MDDVASFAFSDNTLRWLNGGAREQRLLQTRPSDLDPILFAPSRRTVSCANGKNPPMNHAPISRQARTLHAAIALLAAVLTLPACAQAPVVTLTPKVVRTDDGSPAPAAAAPSATATAATAADGDDPSAAVAPPIDPVRPDTRVDLDDRSARIDLWQRIRNGFAIPAIDDRYVKQREKYFSGQPEYMGRMTERGSRYLFHIVEEVQRRGLPTELALLPFIESAFNPEAMSSARAAGMWQFMPATGRHFDLKQNIFRDERRDVLASTNAALDYLTRLHGMFGDWHLALAAYNWGEGNVQRAVRSNRAAGRPAGYADLKMPFETRDYVPKLQAMKNIVLRPADYALTLPVLENHPYFLAVPISRDIDVALVTQLSGLPLDQFKQLNPQMNKPVIVAAGTPQLLLPYDNANAFVKALPLHKGPLSSWTAWTVPKTMKAADAAQAVGMEEDELREVNAIPPRMLVQAGSTLLVARSRTRDGDVSVRMADSAMISFSPDGPALKRVALKVGKGGDSVASVAKRYAVTSQQVAQWNRVAPGARLAAGSTVVVYVPNTRGAPSARAAVRTAKAAPSSRAKASDKQRVSKRVIKPTNKTVKVAAGSATRKR
jgi:membrane-bound lytic murein transglycosylase D